MTEPYAASGVDTEAGDLAVSLMKKAVSATHNDKVFGSLGGFAGAMDVSFLKSYNQPLLATSTDGVGTKVAIAQAIDKHDTIGQDLVGMVVDDIVVMGAKSLFMTDYIACGKLVPTRIADIVRGIAEACKKVNVSLLGGETAEHPGLLGPDDYDVAAKAISSQAILDAIHCFCIQYDMETIIKILVKIDLSNPLKVKASRTMNAIADWQQLDDKNYHDWQEFILTYGAAAELDGFGAVHEI
jgi:phosphoribosylaminoimidazole synthetase